MALEGLARLVGQLDGYLVLEPAAIIGEEDLTRIDSLNPYIVLLAIRMPGLD
ncbi:response regulator transcription factor, partial [Pseudomonas sp. Pseusp97]